VATDILSLYETTIASEAMRARMKYNKEARDAAYAGEASRNTQQHSSRSTMNKQHHTHPDEKQGNCSAQDHVLAQIGYFRLVLIITIFQFIMNSIILTAPSSISSTQHCIRQAELVR
jgi:hypothetical protein